MKSEISYLKLPKSILNQFSKIVYNSYCESSNKCLTLGEYKAEKIVRRMLDPV
jgi:hypothetical protein